MIKFTKVFDNLPQVVGKFRQRMSEHRTVALVTRARRIHDDGRSKRSMPRLFSGGKETVAQGKRFLQDQGGNDHGYSN